MSTHPALPWVGLLLTLAAALLLEWQARDLIWSLWLSSLLLGWVDILLMLGRAPWPLRRRLGQGLFFLFHFSFFHFVHAMVLSDFLPLSQGSGADTDRFPALFTSALQNYWPMVLATALSQWDKLGCWPEGVPLNKVMARPYRNVVLLHLTILALALLEALGWQSAALWLVLLLLYGPWARSKPVIESKKAQH